MNNLFESLRSAVVYRADSNGKVLLKRMRGSSIDLPEIDEQATHKNVEFLMEQLLSQASSDIVLSDLRDSVRFVKSCYTQTHDGFRVAKGAGGGRRITISDVYSFSVAASFCLDVLPPAKRETGASAGIGVMAPATQDCGKNLIKLIWKVAGFDVVDLGNTVHPETWLSGISRQNLSVVGISCMSNKCIAKVRKLLGSLTHQGLSLPVIIGGIAANRVIAFDLAKEYGLPVYYGCDVNDATEVLEKALAKIPVEVPEIKNVEEVSTREKYTALTHHSRKWLDCWQDASIIAGEKGFAARPDFAWPLRLTRCVGWQSQPRSVRHSWKMPLLPIVGLCDLSTSFKSFSTLRR